MVCFCTHIMIMEPTDRGTHGCPPWWALPLCARLALACTPCHTSYPGSLLPACPGRQHLPHQVSLPPSQLQLPLESQVNLSVHHSRQQASEVRDCCLLSVPRAPSSVPDAGAGTHPTVAMCLVNLFTHLFLRLHNRQNS